MELLLEGISNVLAVVISFSVVAFVVYIFKGVKDELKKTTSDKQYVKLPQQDNAEDTLTKSELTSIIYCTRIMVAKNLFKCDEKALKVLENHIDEINTYYSEIYQLLSTEFERLNSEEILSLVKDETKSYIVDLILHSLNEKEVANICNRNRKIKLFVIEVLCDAIPRHIEHILKVRVAHNSTTVKPEIKQVSSDLSKPTPEAKHISSNEFRELYADFVKYNSDIITEVQAYSSYTNSNADVVDVPEFSTQFYATRLNDIRQTIQQLDNNANSYTELCFLDKAKTLCKEYDSLLNHLAKTSLANSHKLYSQRIYWIKIRVTKLNKTLRDLEMLCRNGYIK